MPDIHVHIDGFDKIDTWSQPLIALNGLKVLFQIQPFDPGYMTAYPDNTALNAVKLTCADQHGNVTGTITSGLATCEPGAWGTTTSCSTPGHYLTSFKVQNDAVGVTVSDFYHVEILISQAQSTFQL